MGYNKKSLHNLLNGRERKYSTIEEFQEKCVEYFSICLKEEICPVVSGLVFHLGFADAGSLQDYEGYKDENNQSFSLTIKKARNFIKKSKEEWLVSGKGSATGLIFDLKNNYGYEDVSNINHNVNSVAPIDWTNDKTSNQTK